MTSKSRYLLFAATLMAAPISMAMAQGTGSMGNSSVSGSPSTSTSTDRYGSSAATNPSTPGATGRTVVPGSSSSMANSGRTEPDPNKASTTAGSGGGGAH